MTPTERAKTVLRRVREIKSQAGRVRERDWIREIEAQINQAVMVDQQKAKNSLGVLVSKIKDMEALQNRM